MPTPYAEPPASLVALGVYGQNGATPATAGSATTTAILSNRSLGTKAAGQTIAAGGIVAQSTLTPAKSGKVKVSVSIAGSIDAPIRVLVTRTPFLGAPVDIISFPNTNSGGWVSLSFVLEVDGLPLGVLQSFKAITTLGDGNLTIGDGVNGVGAAVLLEELS
jgi:hypothetical protein